MNTENPTTTVEEIARFNIYPEGVVRVQEVVTAHDTTYGVTEEHPERGLVTHGTYEVATPAMAKALEVTGWDLDRLHERE